jgi:hypothetical protein
MKVKSCLFRQLFLFVKMGVLGSCWFEKFAYTYFGSNFLKWEFFMKKHSFFFPIFFLILSALACNFDSSLITGQMPPATSAPVIATPASTQEEETVSTEEVAGTEEVAETEEVVETEEVSVLTPTEENDGKLDPCTLLTAKQAESILGEPVSPAEVKNGSCVIPTRKINCL